MAMASTGRHLFVREVIVEGPVLGRILPFLLSPERVSRASGLIGAPATYEVPRQASNPTDAHQPCPGLNCVDVARRGPVDHHPDHQSGNGAKAGPW